MIKRVSLSSSRASFYVLCSIFLPGTLLSGCRLQSRNHASLILPHTEIFVDHTASTSNLQPEIIRLATVIAASIPPRASIEAATFGSDVLIAPFYTGTIRNPAIFHKAITVALSKPCHGQGTYGAPILRRIRERIRLSNQPTVVVILSDCGFNDLPKIRDEAKLLAKEPNLRAIYAMPAVSDSSAYTKFEEALRPLGNRVRLAALADTSEALRELQAILRKRGD